MKDSPLIIGLLAGLVMILLIAGVSLAVKKNALSGEYKQQLARNITLEKALEEERGISSDLSRTVEGLQAEVATLKEDMLALEKLKEKLEENLKEELMKNELGKEEFSVQE